jgi:hypothetical protein
MGPAQYSNSCHYCDFGTLRRSHFRLIDLLPLLLLLVAVRCRSCLKRQYIFWPLARKTAGPSA